MVRLTVVLMVVNILGGINTKAGEKFKAGFDSLNVRFVGNWPFGASHAVEIILHIDGEHKREFKVR